jgi:hypothetical protein
MGFFLFATASEPVLGRIQPPFHWVPGAVTPELKRPGREADHSPTPNAEVKNAWSYTATPPIRLHGVVFNRARDSVFIALCLVTYMDNFAFLPLPFRVKSV